MKKFLSVLLALLLAASLVPLTVFAVPATTDTYPDITEEQGGRTYFYYESFANGGRVTQGAANVLTALGWSTPNATTHEANVSATEQGADYVPLFEVSGGHLFIRNRGASTEYITLADDALVDALKRDFTLEYTLTYLPTTSGMDGYFTVLYGGNAAMTTYGMAPVRVSGWGNNYAVLSGTQHELDGGDCSLRTDRAVGMNAYLVTNDVNPTLYERLYGNVDVVPGTGNGTSLKGSRVLVNKQLRVRMEFDGTTAPRIWINDILVSDPTGVADAEARFAQLLASGGAALGFAVSAGVDCVVDDIVAYADAEGAETMALGNLYITEIAPLPTNEHAPYIEVYNGGTVAVNLAEYTLGWFEMRAGGASLVSVDLSNYIGKTLATDILSAISNLGAAEAVLQPGETVLIFPVANRAEVAALVATEQGVSLAGLRAAYGLDADAKLLVIPESTCTYTDAAGHTGTLVNKKAFRMSAEERCIYFIGATCDAVGNVNNYLRVGAEEISAFAYTESVAELVPMVAFGFDASTRLSFELLSDARNPLSSHFGRDGQIQQGFAAHFLYGADASRGAKSGMLLGRRSASGAGEILPVQETYFGKINAYRNGAYNAEGGLVITEYIPVTENDLFDAFELANNSTAAINVYDYGLAVGENGIWTGASVLAPDAAFATISDYTANPTDPDSATAYTLAPGETVVVWNVTAAASGATIAAFRAYHGLSADVTVILLDSTADGALTVPNAGTCVFAVAKATDIAASADVALVTSSEVLVPLDNLYYALESGRCFTPEELLRMAPDVFGMALKQYGGRLQTTSFLFGMIAVAVEDGTSLEGYYTKEAVVIRDAQENVIASYDRYLPCDATQTGDGTTTYYRYAVRRGYEKFCFWGNLVDTAVPEKAVVTFAYGETATDAKTTGALMQTWQAADYVYAKPSEVGQGALPHLIATNGVCAAYLTVSAKVQGVMDTHTFGTIAKKQGVTSSVALQATYYKLTYQNAVGETVSEVSFAADCNEVYVLLADTSAKWIVNAGDGDVAYNAGDKVVITGSTTIRPDTTAN